MKKAVCVLLWGMMLAISVAACAQEFDAQLAKAWLSQLAQTAASAPVSNDPAMTADPARAGQTLYAYDFGTVLSASQVLSGESILEAELRTDALPDCRGVLVGMPLAHALSGVWPGESTTSLYVLGTQESGYGWSWAYVNDGGVYGVEYVSYGGEGMSVKEYTLTYVISPEETISAIRMRVADATQAQAEQGLSTALEIMSRQTGEIYAQRNDQAVLAAQEMAVRGGRVLYAPVADLIACIGEPQEIQTLPDGLGRILVYDRVVAELDVRDATGEEVVLGVTAASPQIEGPRGLTVGMSVQEAAGLFRCDSDVSSMGGVLYLEGEAVGEPPYGEMVRETADGVLLRYVCSAEDGMNALLEIGVDGGAVTYWHMFMQAEAGQ